MSLLHSCLDLAAICSQLVLPRVLLGTKFTFSQLEVIDFYAACLFVLLGILGKLLKLVLLVIKSLGEILDSTTRCLDLRLHANMLFERC